MPHNFGLVKDQNDQIDKHYLWGFCCYQMPHDFGLVKDYFQQDILVDTALIQFTQEIDSAEVAGDFNQWEKVKVQLHLVTVTVTHCCTTGSPVPAM